MKSVLTITLALFLSAAPAAHAAGWSAAMPVSGPGGFVQRGQDIVGNARGDAIAGWERNDRVEVTRRTAGGPFAAPVKVGGRSAPSLALNDAGDAIAVSDDGRRLVGTWFTNTKEFTLTAGECTPALSGVALDAAGTATVVWSSCRQLFFADVPRGGAPGPPQTVPAAGFRGGAGFVGGADGTQIVWWHDVGVLHYAVRLPGGAFTPSSVPADENRSAYIALNDGGSAVMLTDAVAFKPPGATTFAPAYALGTGTPEGLAIAADGSATAVVDTGPGLAAVPLTASGPGGPQPIVKGDTCGASAEYDAAGTLYVIGRASCGGGATWGAVRPAGGAFSGKVRVFVPIKGASQYPPSLAASGAGAVAVWPVGAGRRHIMAAVAFRATPLIAFVGRPTARRVRLRASQPVTVVVRTGGRTIRRQISGTRTLRIRASRRVVVSVPGGDEIAAQVRRSSTRETK